MWRFDARQGAMLNLIHIKMKRVKITNLERLFIDKLIESLYAEAGFTDVDVADLAKAIEKSKATTKGVLGSLVKKGLVSTEDSGTGYDLIIINECIYHYHPAWSAEVEVRDEDKVRLVEEDERV